MSILTIRLRLKQQSRCEMQNLLGNLNEIVTKIRLLVVISVCLSVCVQVRTQQSCEICGSHGAVFGGFMSSGMRHCTLGLVVRLWMAVFKGWVVQEDVLTHEDESITIFQNAGTQSPIDTASCLRSFESSTRQRLKGFSWNLVLEILLTFFFFKLFHP